MIAVFGFRLSAWREAPQNGAPTTTVADTVYMADVTTANGTLMITRPGFVIGIEGMCQSKSGPKRKMRNDVSGECDRDVGCHRMQRNRSI